MRDGKQLLLETRPYAREHRPTSWWCLLSTLLLFAALEAVVVIAEPLWLRLTASVLAGLLIVRLFIVYHDFQHGTILKGSRVARAIMLVYGLLTLNPPSIWRRSHDHHHRHNAKLFGASVGSFPIMSIDAYRAATPRQRLAYLTTRHPMIFALGYITIFLYGMCIRSLMANPRAHADSAVAIAAHAGLAVALGLLGMDLLLLCLVIPSAISAMVGAYLFYAQHNFPDARFKPAGEWDYVTAALQSSSYLRTGPVMAWFTGNIGYHHAHHLNHHVPFYRLPQMVAAMPELQSPGTTSLSLADLRACLRLKLWDPSSQRLVPLSRARDARTESPAPRLDHPAPAGKPPVEAAALEDISAV